MAVGVQSFFPTGRAWIFDSSDWFRHHRRLRVWLHESVWISLAHTHTDWGLHTETHTRHFLDNTNPRVPCSDNNFDNQLVREKSIDPPNWCVCVIKSVLHSWFFILKLHSRRLQRGHCSSLPPHKFFSSKSPETSIFSLGRGFLSRFQFTGHFPRRILKFVDWGKIDSTFGSNFCLVSRSKEEEGVCVVGNICHQSRVQDGGFHQLWSSRKNQQQLQQRGSSASGVSGGGVCYIVCVCVFRFATFFF